MADHTYTAEEVLELALAFEARAKRARVVYGAGKERCVTSETLEDCARQVRRFAAMPAPARTAELDQYLRQKRVTVETVALDLEFSAKDLPPRHAAIALDAVMVLRRFLDLEGDCHG